MDVRRLPIADLELPEVPTSPNEPAAARVKSQTPPRTKRVKKTGLVLTQGEDPLSSL